MNIADEFLVHRHAGVLESQAPRVGENLLTNNADFEKGDFTGFVTSTNWTVIAANSVTPNGVDNYMAQAGSALADGTITRATLETNKYNVTGETEYFVRCAFGAPKVGDTLLNQSPNSLRVAVKWFDSGNNLLSTVDLMNERIDGVSFMSVIQGRVFSPSAAAKMALYLVNRHANLNNAAQAGGTVVDELFATANAQVTTPPLIESLRYSRVNREGFRGLRYGNHFQQGYKQCEFTVYGTPDYLWDWMTRALQNHILVTFGGTTVFEGMVFSMECMIQGAKYAVSLNSLANHIVIDYGDNKHYPLSHRASMARWGRKDYSESVKGGINAARERAEYLLALMKDPKPRLVEYVGERAQADNVKVTVMGYYTGLTFVKNVRWNAARGVDMAAAIATGSKSLLNNLRAKTVNDWFSTDYTWVTSTGRTVHPLSRKEVNGKSVADLIQMYLQRGTANQRAICAGVWENRHWRMEERPTFARYQLRRLKSGELKMLEGGAALPLPLVRAGEYVRIPSPIPQWRETYSDIEDDFVGALFLKEVEMDVERGTLRMLTPQAEPLELKIGRAVMNARVGRTLVV